MSASVFQDPSIYARDLPAPATKFSGLPRFNFTGGHNDPVHIPVAEYFGNHFDEHVPRLTAVLKDKRDTMIEAVEREFGTDAELFKPEGGIFLWIKLPDAVDVTELIAPAADVGVAFNPGPEWSVDAANGKSYLRLCFGSASKENIDEGVKRFARVCYEHTGIPARSDNAPHRRE